MQRLSFSHRAIFAITLTSLIGFSACSKRPTGPVAGAGGKSAPTEAGSAATSGVATAATGKERYLTFNNLAEPEFMDPLMMAGRTELSLALALFEGLLEYNPKMGGDPLPGVAERFEISADGLTYTFFLRKNAKWSNGDPVTAKDFVYSWQRELDPKIAAQYASIMFIVKNAEAYNLGKITDPNQVGVKAVDDFTFQVTLEHPAPYFKELLCIYSFRPIHKATVEQFGNEWTRPEHFVGNGAFVLKEWVPHKEIVVAKSSTYWDAANVKLAGIRFLPLEDLETSLKMYESGQLDVNWELPPVKVPGFMARPDFVKAPENSTYFIRVNTTKPPFDNPKVRQALAMALDRKTLVEKYLQNIEVAWDSLVPTGMKGYTPAPGLPFDPAGAKKLLADAGFPDPSALSIQYTYNTTELHRQVAQVIQQMWQENLGIKVELVNEEWKSYLKDMQGLNYQTIRAGWIGDYTDPMTFVDLFTSVSTQNETGWKNPQYDALVKQATQEPDPAKRSQMMAQAEMLILQQAPIIPLYTYAKKYLAKPFVHGFYPNLSDAHPFKFVWIDEAAASATASQ